MTILIYYHMPAAWVTDASWGSSRIGWAAGQDADVREYQTVGFLGLQHIKVDCSARSEVLESRPSFECHSKCSSMDTVQNTPWVVSKLLSRCFLMEKAFGRGLPNTLFLTSSRKSQRSTTHFKPYFLTSLDCVMGMWWLCWNFYAVGPPAQPEMPSLSIPLGSPTEVPPIDPNSLGVRMAVGCRKIQLKMWSHLPLVSTSSESRVLCFEGKECFYASKRKILLDKPRCVHWRRYLVSPPFTSPAAADELKGFFDSGSLSWA